MKISRHLKAIVVWGMLLGVALAGGQSETNTHDVLVYKDGDRLRGQLLRREGDVLVFKADRFGELRVPAADAVVIKGEAASKPVTPATAPVVAEKAAPTTPPKTPEAHAEEEKVQRWEWFLPSVLTAKVREFFGPWHGRVAVSTESVSDTTDRQGHAVDATLKRKWERDELNFNARYDFAQTNDVTTTDTLRGSGSWRHDFNKREFAQYRPSVEWNRASKRAGVPNEYVLLQQEIGAGVTLLATPTRKLRTGVSQNLFDLWNSAPTPDHTSHGVQSTFEEVEFTLPWRMGLTQRGVWYPVRDQPDGWENRVELNKKLTETLSASLRHEIRRHNPDGTSQDYTRLKLLVGLDF